MCKNHPGRCSDFPPPKEKQEIAKLAMEKSAPNQLGDNLLIRTEGGKQTQKVTVVLNCVHIEV